MAKIIVTGGCGFIGSHLVDRLIKDKHEVIIIDNLSTGRKDFINPKAKFINADLVTDQLLDLFKGIDYVFHEAAIPRIQLSLEHPEKTFKANVYATQRVLQWAGKQKVKRVIYASSSSVYGKVDELGISRRFLPLNEFMPCDPLSPYASQKYMSEIVCKSYAFNFGLDVVALRYFNVYGKRMSTTGVYKLVMAIWNEQKQKGVPLTIYGDGKQTRDFCVTKDTLILMENWKWRKIKDLEIGDKVISYSEKPIKRKRFFKLCKIIKKLSYISNNIYNVKTELGQVKATGNHPWLMNRRGFKNTDKLLVGQKIRSFSKPILVDKNKDYKKGYIVGTMNGDGYLFNKGKIFRIGLGVIDKDFRDEFFNICEEFNIKLNKKEKVNNTYINAKKIFIAESSKKENYLKIKKIIKKLNFKNKDFCRGYIAGIFDSEGEYHYWELKISNNNQKILNNIKKILNYFNFKYSYLLKKETLYYITVLGGLSEHIRFFSLFNPVILRKRPKLKNKEIKGKIVKILEVKKIKPERVYNLEIENEHTYILNGLLSHNTYIDDVVEANILAMNMKKGYDNFQVFNVCSGQEMMIYDIARMFNHKIEFVPNPREKWEERRKVGDYGLAESRLGYKPKIFIEEGIKRYLNNKI